LKRAACLERPSGPLVAIMIAPVVALAIVAGCRQEPVVVPETAVQVTAASSNPFVGSAVCAECHGAEFKIHQTSGHARTLRRADVGRLDSASPPVGKIPDTPYAIREESGRRYFSRSDDPSTGGQVQYALGSGKTAVTYIGDIGSDRLTEFRMSYDPAHHIWFTTPGQVGNADLKLGTVFELGMATRCILCHADKVAAGSAKPADGFLGVGCESCHGPGGAHIAAVKDRHTRGIFMDKIGQWGAARIDALCARCHRSVDDISLDQYDASNTARFQPYSLELSPCFKKSGGRLSCITCHEPHTDASTDRHNYEKVCLSCHSTAAKHAAAVCPVNPRELCVGCHMPKRSIFPSAHVPLSIADHLIWAYRPKNQ
jgi:Cytochrome c3